MGLRFSHFFQIVRLRGERVAGRELLQTGLFVWLTGPTTRCFLEVIKSYVLKPTLPNISTEENQRKLVMIGNITRYLSPVSQEITLQYHYHYYFSADTSVMVKHFHSAIGVQCPDCQHLVQYDVTSGQLNLRRKSVQYTIRF
ncbi:hypothetical protein Hamer_G030075 [Homarus americanus]|uniref:Uncharacterized protein n=1 Tax=Homarus americanus TaxID=6706 RepID=A0A8J5NB54_HOMAM|nr:hypothetical protein Hamer_G030075 [Homarus americanus]